MTRAFHKRIRSILDENAAILQRVTPGDVEKLIKALVRAEKIFIYGQGRTGHVSRAFATRLMQMGMEVHFVGETTTPRISRRDLCLVNSGTGQTRFVYHVAAAAKEAGAKLATITAHPEARIGQMADIVVTVPAPTKGETLNRRSRQPQGSLFEQAALLMMDAIVMILMDRLHITPSRLARRHANIE